MKTNLSGKIVCVTGGARGIGRAVVESFCEEGAICHFTYASSDGPANELVEELNKKDQRAVAHKADVREAASMRELMETIEKEHGQLDVLVNNAGIIRDQLLLAMEEDDWADVLNTNLTGVYNTIRPAIRMMMRKRQGSIVNMSSVAGTRPGKGHSNYAATKGGVEAMTKALAAELSARNIRVNAVAPGMIETDMSKKVRDLAADQILPRILLKRFGTPQDIANAVLFLGSDLGAYITGTVLHVDGGIGA